MSLDILAPKNIYSVLSDDQAENIGCEEIKPHFVKKDIKAGNIIEDLCIIQVDSVNEDAVQTMRIQDIMNTLKK